MSLRMLMLLLRRMSRLLIAKWLLVWPIPLEVLLLPCSVPVGMVVGPCGWGVAFTIQCFIALRFIPTGSLSSLYLNKLLGIRKIACIM